MQVHCNYWKKSQVSSISKVWWFSNETSLILPGKLQEKLFCGRKWDKNEQNLWLDPLERLTANLESELGFLLLYILWIVLFSLPFFFFPPATRMHHCILQPISDKKPYTTAILGKYLNISLCNWRKWCFHYIPNSESFSTASQQHSRMSSLEKTKYKIKYSCYKLLIIVYNSNNPTELDHCCS